MKNIIQWYKSKVIYVASKIKRNTMELKEVQRQLVRTILKIHLQRRMENTELVYLKEINKVVEKNPQNNNKNHIHTKTTTTNTNTYK